MTRRPAPPSAQAGHGGGGEWVLLTVARNHVVAHLLTGRLNEDGIESFMETFNSSPGAWLNPFGDQMAPVRIFVHRSDLESASLLLHEVGHRPPDPNQAPPSGVRRLWWMSMLAVIAVTMLTVLEIVGFAPCIIRIFCF